MGRHYCVYVGSSCKALFVFGQLNLLSLSARSRGHPFAVVLINQHKAILIRIQPRKSVIYCPLSAPLGPAKMLRYSIHMCSWRPAPRFLCLFSASVVPTPVGDEVSTVIAPRAQAHPQRQRPWMTGSFPPTKPPGAPPLESRNRNPRVGTPHPGCKRVQLSS